jgi:hypothetical protein
MPGRHDAAEEPTPGPLGIGSHGPFESLGRFLPEHTTAVFVLGCLPHHANVIDPKATATACARDEHQEVPA